MCARERMINVILSDARAENVSKQQISRQFHVLFRLVETPEVALAVPGTALV